MRSRRPGSILAGLLLASGLAAAPPELPRIQVTASRGPGTVDESVFPVRIFDGGEIRRSPAVLADDLLRELPGFSLFRRAGSLSANPTTQGVSLRQIGGSGASRSLVLVDGLPFNDAFGSWVYWSRLNLESIERVEVLRGGASAAWGNAALSGVVHLVRREPEAGTLETAAAVGNLGTIWTSGYASEIKGPWAVTFSGRYFESDGYQRVAGSQRGPVDTRSDSRHTNYDLSLRRSFEEGSAELRVNHFEEVRGNGTALARNSSEIQRVEGRFAWSGGSGDWRGALYGEHASYDSTFTAVDDARASEVLVLDQFDVPGRSIGGYLSQSSDIWEGIELTRGIDGRWISGETNERVVLAGDTREAGGEQVTAGLYGDAKWSTGGAWRIQGTARMDYWKSGEGFLKQPNTMRQSFADRSEWLFSSRLGVVRDLGERFRVRGAAYQSYRVPTVNELYRPFRVGDDSTLANEALSPEKLNGIDLGFDFDTGDRWTASVTTFWNRMEDPVVNATIGATGSGGALRQRQNVEAARVVGVEWETACVLAPGARVFFEGVYSESEIDDPGALDGKRLAQSPGLSARIGLERSFAERLQLELAGRYVGAQFEDDRNSRKLDSFWTLDAAATFAWTPRTEIFLKAQNLLDRSYADGINADNEVTEGTPRWILLGARTRW